jgi:peptide/nickel transport system permease protein
LAIYIAKRVLGAIPLLIATSFLVFAFVHIAPGSPETVLLGGRNVSPQTLHAIRAQYHLDDPFLVQYWHWLTNAAQGDFGQSITFNDSVGGVVAARTLPTLELAAYGGLLIVVFGSLLGIIAGTRRGTRVDTITSGVMLLGSSVSTYVSGIVLITIFAVALGWFPVFGLGGGGLDRVYHLTLPAVSLAIALGALVGRTMRASLSVALEREFVETARSRGLPEYRVIGKHALRSALLPVVTVSGIVFGYLIPGAVLVEYTFGLNGLGSLVVKAVQTHDFVLVQAVTLLFTVAFILINLVADLLYVVIDPSVRLASRAG